MMICIPKNSIINQGTYWYFNQGSFSPFKEVSLFSAHLEKSWFLSKDFKEQLLDICVLSHRFQDNKFWILIGHSFQSQTNQITSN